MADQQLSRLAVLRAAPPRLAALEAWAGPALPVDHADTDAACRALVTALGEAGALAANSAERDGRSTCARCA
jgi:hypothetical protein